MSLSTVRAVGPIVAEILAALVYRDFSGGIALVQRAMAESVARWQKASGEVSGLDRIARIRGMLRSLFPDVLRMKILQNVAPAMLAFRLIESLSTRWLGDAAELGDLAKAPSGNVTTEMGLALGDVADVVRTHPGAIERLRGQTTRRSSQVSTESRAGRRSAGRSERSLNATACGVPARSTSRDRAGVRPRRSSSPRSRAT